MDKSWMSRDIFSTEYVEGVNQFLTFAFDNAKRKNCIPCPCIECGNMYEFDIVEVGRHLRTKGIEQTYCTWVWHGEDAPKESASSRESEEGFDEGGLDEAANIAKMFEATEETFMGNPEKLCELIEEADLPLYDGCKKYTKLSSLVKLFNVKAMSGWSDKSFSMVLALFKDMLPDCNELPLTMREAKETLSVFGIKHEKIHACPNDCILYRGLINKDRTTCPTCGASRYKVKKNNPDQNYSVPAKVLWYFPIIPRLKKMFQSVETAKNLVWHANEREVVDGQMSHPADSQAWRHVDQSWPEFAADSRSLRFALSTDGFNPHSSLSSRHSCWPVILATYNLPPWLCMKRKFLMLTLLISGPHQPGNNIDVYLAPLIEDLQLLWQPGVEVYDAYKQESFILRAVLLWTISDFPAFGNLAGCTVKGYLACPVCGENTDSIRLKHGKKNVYQAHRRWLPENHPYRKEKRPFNGKQELRSSPESLNGVQIFTKVEHFKNSWGKPPESARKSKKSKKEKARIRSKGSKKRKRGKEQISSKDTETPKRRKTDGVHKNHEEGRWKKRSIFFELPYWRHLLLRHNLDVMHIEKNVCDSIIGTLLNIPLKTKDSLQSRLDLVEMHLREELAPEKRGTRFYLPPACYTLSREEKEEVCNTLFELKVPDGYCSNFKSCVSMKDLKLYGLKSHDCHRLMQQLLPVAIRSVLPKHVRYTIIRLCFFFNALCTKIVDVSKLDNIQKDLVVTLCLLEKFFPPSFFDIMVHLTVHLVREVELCGPVFFRWMYPFERYMMVLKGYVRNRNRPEGCMAENYIAEEAVEFCAEFLSEVDAIGVPSTRNMTDNDLEDGDTICSGRPIGGSHVVEVDEKSWQQAHLYVLENMKEVQPYIKEHMDYLRLQNHRKGVKWIKAEHNRTFINWLRQKVEEEQDIPNNKVSETLQFLAMGPSLDVLKYSGYEVKGFRYHTKDQEAKLVNQNSGVSVVASAMQISSAKDKNPVISDMCFYGVLTEVWVLDYLTFEIPIFKCDWVDSKRGIKVDELGFTSVQLGKVGHKFDPFILASQAKQVFYVSDQLNMGWSVVLATPERDYRNKNDDAGFDDDSITDKALPTIDSFDLANELPLPYARENCEGIWVEPE